MKRTREGFVKGDTIRTVFCSFAVWIVFFIRSYFLCFFFFILCIFEFNVFFRCRPGPSGYQPSISMGHPVEIQFSSLIVSA